MLNRVSGKQEFTIVGFLDTYRAIDVVCEITFMVVL